MISCKFYPIEYLILPTDLLIHKRAFHLTHYVRIELLSTAPNCIFYYEYLGVAAIKKIVKKRISEATRKKVLPV